MNFPNDIKPSQNFTFNHQININCFLLLGFVTKKLVEHLLLLKKSIPEPDKIN